MIRRIAILVASLALTTLGPAASASAATLRPAPGTTQPQELDLDALVGWPFPSGLVAAAAAPVVAWVRNERGERNVWVARAPEWSGRAVTEFGGDNGQEIGGLAVSADGSTVAFVRGGAPNRAGEVPNPTSDPDGARREVWTASTHGGDAARVARGHSPLLTADGGRLYYIHGDVILRLAVGDSDAEPDAEPEELVTGRGSPGEMILSPDETRLAWTSRRGDHSFVGVLDLRDRSLRYLDPSLDRDSSPVWSPDGREVAFVRIPSQKGRLPFFAVRESTPWSIRVVGVVDVEDGAARTVFTAPPGAGSVFNGVSASRQLFWGRSGRIAFPWEGTGFRNLYSVAANGGSEPQPIATGSFEVQYVAQVPGGGALIFSSNQDDTDRQHLWRGAMDGSDTRLITPGDGIEWQPAPTADGSLAFLAASGTAPAHAEVLAAPAAVGAEGERQWLVPDQEADLPSGLADPAQVVFTAPDGTPIHGQLFLPNGAPPAEGWPGALFLHGGSRRQMLLGFHHRGYYHNAYSFNQYLASKGYAVLSVNYRSGTGYGMAFREAENYGAGGASEVQDVLGAGLYLAGRHDVDADRIGLWGGSYGGYLTAHGLAQASRLFRAGVDVHGVHDWNPVIRNFVPSYDPAARPEVARSAFESSPMAFLDGWRSPVLLIHGDDDRNVPFSESVELAEELRRRGVHVEHLVFPDEVHGFLLHRNWMAAFRAASDFFDRFLMRDGS